MRTSVVYERRGSFYIHSSSKTTAGVWIINAPFFCVSGHSAMEVGKSVRDCLAASREGVPHPTYFKGLFEPILRLAGVRSFSAFAKDTKSIGIEDAGGGNLVLTPTKNGGSKEGFMPLMKSSVVPLGSDEALGLAVFAALEGAE